MITWQGTRNCKAYAILKTNFIYWNEFCVLDFHQVTVFITYTIILTCCVTFVKYKVLILLKNF